MPLSIAILGTRGIPASYGGFETFAQELGLRLVERGHQVTVYCRSHHTPRDLGTFRGVRLVVLPTIRHKYFDTVAHSLVSSLHALGARHDVVLLCNAINSSFIPLIKASGARVAINVDGLEWQRKKWNSLGKACYRVSEKIACLAADVIVSDSQTVRAYYRAVHRTPTVFIPYGAPTDKTERNGTLERFGLEAGKYILYVSRFEPENNPHLVLEAFKQAPCIERAGYRESRNGGKTLEAQALFHDITRHPANTRRMNDKSERLYPQRPFVAVATV